jgi:site-specific DNA-cytosine methylase
VAKVLVSGRDFLQIRDAARLLRVSEKTLRNWDRAGHLRAHRHPVNGYRLYRVADLHALLDRVADLPDEPLEGAQHLPFDLGESDPTDAASETLPPCHWSRAVALDPKHRPQKWTTPATTVRRDWRKFPQEAHLLDAQEQRYRRFTVEDVALLQGFAPDVVNLPGLTERERISVLGDAVPPPVARALVKGISSRWRWQNRTAVEICAGIGGLAEGAAAAELEHLLLIDASEVCTRVLRHKRPWPAERVVHGDVRTEDFARFRGRVGLLSGGPPCQPWSQGGLRQGDVDKRDLLGMMPDLVQLLRPEVFVFENVPGLAMFADGDYLTHLVWRFRCLQYGVLVAQLNAADFGVPQIRNRIFILGVRDEPAAFASSCFDAIAQLASHRDPTSTSDGRLRWRTVGDVLEGRDDPGGWRRWIGASFE